LVSKIDLYVDDEFVATANLDQPRYDILQGTITRMVLTRSSSELRFQMRSLKTTVCDRSWSTTIATRLPSVSSSCRAPTSR
jgi:hypothetical protein